MDNIDFDTACRRCCFPVFDPAYETIFEKELNISVPCAMYSGHFFTS